MISDHAIDNCLERVMGIDKEVANSIQREEAKRLIEAAYYDPEEVLENEADSCPIHINGEVAIPVKTEVIPTTYNSETFKG